MDFPILNCTPPAIDNYPNGILSFSELLNGGFIGPLALAFYMISGIAILCDEYFVPSLEFARTELQIRAHIAGATIMAIGTSAPEFFTNVMGTFVAQDNIGIGTILGSALFNIFAVLTTVGLTNLMSHRHPLQLQFYPITRDVLIYGASIFTLVLVMVDGVVTWVESLLLICLYVIYMLILIFDNKVASIFSQVSENDMSFEEKKLIQVINEEGEDSIEEDPHFKYPWSGICSERKGILSTLQRLKLFPLRLLFFLTIPDVGRVSFKWKRYVCPLTFGMSLIYMSGFTYILTWMTTLLTYISGIPDSVAGLTFLAAGTSVPELVSSIIVIRSAYEGSGGAMAVSNLIGSNTFDILICLGIPWLISSATEENGSIEVGSYGLGFNAAILFISLIILYAIIYGNGFYITKTVVWTCLIIYATILTFTILMEANVFYVVNLPLCESKYFKN